MTVPLTRVTELSSTASTKVAVILVAPAGRLKTLRSRISSLAVLAAEAA
jgi:hypothetical protein